MTAVEAKAKRASTLMQDEHLPCGQLEATSILHGVQNWGEGKGGAGACQLCLYTCFSSCTFSGDQKFLTAPCTNEEQANDNCAQID